MKAGAFQLDITPELPVILCGSFHLRRAATVLDPLYASSVSIDDGQSCVIIVSCDLPYIENEAVFEIREIVNKKTGVPKTNVIISATHTHQGLNIGPHSLLPNPSSFPDPALMHVYAKKIAASAVGAYESMRPARMGYSSGSVKKCAFNRRYIMRDGRVRTNPFPQGDNPDRLLVEGPEDDEVQLVWFEDLDGEYIALMVNYSDHPAVLYFLEAVSADFVGSMRNVLQSVLGSQIPVLYLQGACGNIDTYDFQHAETEGLGMKGYTRIGRILAGEVLKILSQSYAADFSDTSIRIRSSVLDIPYRPVSAEEAESAEAAWAGYSEGEKQDDARQEELYPLYSTILLYKMIQSNPCFQAEIAAFSIGDMLFATCPAELFVEYQLALKSRYKNRKVIIMELTNGYAGYVPTPQAFALGGYETVRSLGSRLCEEAGTMLTDGLQKLIDTL